VPERLARLMVEEKPKPRGVEQRSQARDQAVPTPSRWTRRPRRAEGAELRPAEVPGRAGRPAAERRPDTLGQTKNLQGAVGQDSHAERSLIAPRPAGLRPASPPPTPARLRYRRRLAERHDTTAVSSRIVAAGGGASVSKGGSGKHRALRRRSRWCSTATRAIYALYGRALRDTPDLQANLCSSSQSPFRRSDRMPRSLERAEKCGA